MFDANRGFNRKSMLTGATTMLAAVAAAFVPTAARAASDAGADELNSLFSVASGASDPADGRRGFDFLHGRWSLVRHDRKDGDELIRRNLHTPDEHSEWVSTTGTMECRPLVGGLANVDDNALKQENGIGRGSTFRVFDQKQKHWSIFWYSKLYPELDVPPLQGNFKDGVGLFYANRKMGGRSVRIRYKWTHRAAQTARWESAASNDGGATWINDTYIVFTRIT